MPLNSNHATVNYFVILGSIFCLFQSIYFMLQLFLFIFDKYKKVVVVIAEQRSNNSSQFLKSYFALCPVHSFFCLFVM